MSVNRWRLGLDDEYIVAANSIFNSNETIIIAKYF